MKRDWWYGFSFLLVLVVVALMSLVPTFFKLDEKSGFPIKSKINLGLDLQGGLYIVLGVDFNKVYKDEMANFAKKISDFSKEEGVPLELGSLNIPTPNDPTFDLIVADKSKYASSVEFIHKYFKDVVRITAEKDNVITVGLHHLFKESLQTNAVQKSIEVIRNRIDEFGVTEPEIMSLGEDKIVLQLPGIKDIERAKSLVGKTAKLEFKFVNDQVSEAQLSELVEKAKATGIEYKKGDRFSVYVAKINDFIRNEIPAGHEVAFRKSMSRNTTDVEEHVPYLVEQLTSLTGDDLQDASVRFDDQTSRPYVAINFKPQGARIFEEVTGKNVGRRMAIILDGNVYSDPVIREKIAGGSAQISMGVGDYNDLMNQSKDLALVLRAGALPVELDFQEQRVVGPSLGSDSISKAQLSATVGIGIVFLFAIFFYKVSGVIAVITLILNVVFVLAMMVGLEATLTLPGIAGIALTVGMAIDGNIIIFERIKEELKSGAANLVAYQAGFKRAFWTIIDANLTTAIAGLCLMNFGTGPIRGFAVTLLVGIVVTVYCSYFVSKILFDLYLDKTRGKSLSI